LGKIFIFDQNYLTMGKQTIKTESSGFWDDLFGLPPKEVVYEDGKKVGEIRHETNWVGESVDRTYDADGRRVSETRHEANPVGESVDRTYDRDGRRVSETRHESTLLEEPVDRTYDPSGKRVSETTRDTTIFGERVKRVRYEDQPSSRDKIARKGRRALGGIYGGDTSGDEPTSIQAESAGQEYREKSFWGAVHRFFWMLFNPTGFLKQEAGVAISNGNFLQAGQMYERAGDLEKAVLFYDQDLSRDGYLRALGVRSEDPKVLRAQVEMCLRNHEYQAATSIAEHHGMSYEAIESCLLESAHETATYQSYLALRRARDIAFRNNFTRFNSTIDARLKKLIDRRDIYSFLIEEEEKKLKKQPK